MKYLGDVGGGRNGGPRRTGADAVLLQGGEVWSFGGRLPDNKFGDDWQLLNVTGTEGAPRSAPHINPSEL